MSWTEDVLGVTKGKELNCDSCKSDCCRTCFARDNGALFQKLSRAELDLLVSSKFNVKFKAGETIMKQNTVSTNIVCLKKGIVKIYVEGSKEKDIILKVMKDTGIITGGALLSESLRPFTVAAVTDVECCFINSDRVFELFSSNSEFAFALVQQYHDLTNHMFNKLVNLTLKYMPGRVAETILYLKNDVFQENPFPVPFSRQELAEMSAMTKESFVRILKELKSSDSIQFEGKYLKVTDEESLESISRNG